VILEPAAVSDLIGYLGGSFGARDAEQGQSFLSKQGGGTHLGEKMFPEYITLRSDPFNTKLAATPWGPSLLPNEKHGVDRQGRGEELLLRPLLGEQGRQEADAGDRQPGARRAGHTLERSDQVHGQGLLITRFWYIRVLQPQTLQLDRVDSRRRVSGGEGQDDRSGD
jgi:hypothetical protein